MDLEDLKFLYPEPRTQSEVFFENGEEYVVTGEVGTKLQSLRDWLEY